MTVQEEVTRRIAGDPLLIKLRRKIDSGTADFKDTAAYSNRAADIMSEIFARRLPEISLAERETLCVELLHDRHTDINELLGRVQRSLDDAQGLHIAPQHAPFNAERAHQIGSSTADPTKPEETRQRRARSATATAARAMHDDYIRKNADFRSKAGLKCYINREAVPACCEWCTKMAGRYVYGEEPDDVYRRHDNCGCSVTFENGRKRQDVWSKREWEAPEPGAGAGDPVVLTAEQAATAGAGELTRFMRDNPGAFGSVEGLTKKQRRDMIKAAEQMQRDADAAKIIYDAMTDEQRAEVIQRGIQEPNAVFSYDTKDNHFPSNAQRIPKLPNTFDVISHGTVESMEFFPQDYPENDIRAHIDAYTLSQILLGRDDYQRFVADCRERGVKPVVRLLSCNTGNTRNTGNCFAQLLANELGEDISAPTDVIFAYPDGSYEIGLFDDGEMKPFWGRK